MAEYKFSAALNASTFPLVTRFHPRSVVISGLDNRLRNPASAGNNTGADNNPQNLPQVLYAENIIPSDEGVVTVGFEQVQASVAAATEFDEVFILRSATENTWYFSPAQGKNYVTPAAGTAWVSYASIFPNTRDVSIAYVNGVTYVCYAQTRLTHWDGATFINDNGALVGLAAANIRGICGSGNYLVAFTDVSVYWSTLTNPLNFSDVLAGAGTQIPVDIRGQITGLTSMPGGFIIHCLQNAVAALYTNNSAQPWQFREIKNAGGISGVKQISTDNNSGATYIWGTNGLQQINLREAEAFAPDVTDFLAGRVLETFDSGTNLFTVTRLSTDLFVKPAYIAGRYLVISYGDQPGNYTYALIYDIGLRRWGKLKFDHIDCFSGYVGARRSMILLRANGSAYRAVMDNSSFTDAGVLILGKYQLSRASQICSQEILLDVLDTTDNPTVTVLTSYEGGNFDAQAVMTPYVNSGAYRSYQYQIEGTNLTFIVKGTFTLGGMTITATKGAKF